ncbi:MAG TPA: hypothetical protein VHA09_01930 [Nitrososphaera sp.]|nr:hypothetical protein [Nitrososphaera sp.]
MYERRGEEDDDVRKDEEARKPKNAPAELKQNPQEPTKVNMKDFERLRILKRIWFE